MLVRGQKRVIAIVGPIIVIFLLVLIFDENQWTSWTGDSSSPAGKGYNGQSGNFDANTEAGKESTSIPENGGAVGGQTEESVSVPLTHRLISSASTRDGKYFLLDFGDYDAINPNILPHPWIPDRYVMVAQQQRSDVPNSVWCAELVCDAAFREDGTLACIKSPLILPIAATFTMKCDQTQHPYFAWNVGPHDARVFYGPHRPYAIWGSNSAYTCFGMFIQDFRMLVDWGFEVTGGEFRFVTELQRPDSYREIEKNFFIFWDSLDQMYVHHDIAPKRVFAKLEPDGSVGPNLADFSAWGDEACMAKYLPSPAANAPEDIHQATNSISVTLCKRAEPDCEPNDFNTYIVTIVHHKAMHHLHGNYEPYVILFQRTAPFALHGISKRPLWINGRGKWHQPSETGTIDPNSEFVFDGKVEMEMFYVTSLTWKNPEQKYHGYADDTLFVGFGIEDSRTAAIDLKAEDLLQDIGFCFGL